MDKTTQHSGAAGFTASPTPSFLTHRLPNGLTLLGQPMPDAALAACCFFVRTGSRDEPPAVSGVSHFLEHMVFKGTERRTGAEIDRAFEELGAEHNAATSIEYTYYWARILGENLLPTVDLLADMLRPRLDPADLDAERKVILEEIARSHDVPNRVLMRALYEGFFAGHPLANSVLGSPESIAAMTAPAMRAYWQRHYGAANIVFAVAGAFSWDPLRAEVERLCAGWPAGSPERPLALPRSYSGPTVIQRESMEHQLLAAALPSLPDGDPDHYAGEVLTTVLGDSSGSRLYWGVREQGLAEAAGADISHFEGAGMLLVFLSAAPARMSAAWAAARAELGRLQRDGVTARELVRAKTKLTSRLVMDGESTAQRMLSLVGSWTSLGRLETLDEMVAEVEAVTLDDCRRVLDRYPLTAEPLLVTMGPLPEGSL